MRPFVILCILLVLSFNSYSQHYKKDGSLDLRYRENKTYSPQSYNSNSSVRFQNGYIKSNNAYVQPHYKTNKNSTNRDNFSVSGNSNPYTGKKGSRAEDYSPKSNNYGKGNYINEGTRGGQYYTNKKGNKIYVPKRY